jgi:hypothetical protein
MINTFQFLSKYLTVKTLVRLHSITNESYLKGLIIKKLGFLPISLNTLNDEYLLNFRKSLNVYRKGNNLYLFSGAEAIYCNINCNENMYNITVYLSVLKDIKVFKKMMNNFKYLFEEFYFKKCILNHSPDLIVRLNIKDRIYIDIPAYFHCILVKQSKFIKIS